MHANFTDFEPTFFEYKIKSGDTLTGIIKSMYGIAPTNTRYQEFISYILSINPQIKNADFIRAGDILRLSGRYNQEYTRYANQIVGRD